MRHAGGNVSAAMERNNCSTYYELMFRVGLWFASFKELPTREQIEARWGCGRSCAYRWRNAYCDAAGLQIPRPRRIRKSITSAATDINEEREPT